jgi:hypothetical protein
MEPSFINTALRPMTAGELLDRTINLYRRNFLLFFGIGVLPSLFQLLVDLAELALTRAGAGAGVGVAISTFLAVTSVLIGYALAEGATVFAVSAVHLGRTISIKACYGRLRGRFLRVSGVMLLTTAIFVGVAVLILAVGLLAAAFIQIFLPVLADDALISGGTFVAFAFALYVIARYAVAAPACVLEDLEIRQSLHRSADLTKDDRPRVFIISVLGLVLFYGTIWVVLGPVTWLAGERFGEASLLTQIVNLLATFVAQVFVAPIATISMALVYYDERVRKEAFDLEHMMAALDSAALPTASGATAT